jgi:hypothetical protein
VADGQRIADAAPASQAPAAAAPTDAARLVIGEFAFRFDSPIRAQLDAAANDGQPARVLFPVSESRVVDLGIVRHDAQSPARGELIARVDDVPLADAVLAYVDEAVAGTIVTPEGELFQVRYAGNGVHRVTQLDPHRFPDEGEPLVPQYMNAALRAKEHEAPQTPFAAVDQRADWIGSGAPSMPEVIVAPQTAADGPPVVMADATETQLRDGSTAVLDMVIAYTPESRTNNGGVAGMNAVINAAVAKANLAFANSQAGIVLRVVYTVEVAYTSVGNLGADLGAMQSASDGKMDNLYTLKAQTSADLVSLFVPSGQGGVVGLAYLLNPSTMGQGGYNWTFSVVVDWAADGNISFGHEVGHNLGAGHSSDGGCGIYSYACGYRFSVGGNAYRTVMAYSPGLRIPHFSSPDLTYLGAPLGTSMTNNSLTLRQGRNGMAMQAYGPADFTVSLQADLNADNKPDLLSRNVYNGVVNTWLLDNATKTSTSTMWPATNPGDSAWVPVASADFDGDTKPDLVWRNTTSGRVVAWYMNGTTRTGTGVIWPASNPGDALWMPMAAGDFNGDGKPDLVWRHLTAGRVIVWYMDGITRTGTAVIWAATNPGDANWVPLVAGDFNGDNKPDLLWRHQATGRVIVWYLDGVTTTGTFAIFPGNNPGDASWRPMASGDFDADGQTDIVWRNVDSGRVIIWYMNGITRIGTMGIS